jgi:UDP-N-acetylglucosamine 3-dehydrogenase
VRRVMRAKVGVRTKVGIVSFAHMHAHNYAAALGRLGGIAEFVGIADEDGSRGRAVAEQYGVPFIRDAGELLSVADAIIVCTENKDHARFTVEALDRGVHVLCEKPIATTIDDALRMINAAQDSDAQLRVAFPVRYLSSIRQAKKAVETGMIGRVLAVNATNHGKMPDGWFLDLEAAGGGAVMDHTVHVADLLRWILNTEVESVYAEIGATFGDGQVDDSAILTLELANGVFATVDPSWSRGDGYPTWGDVTMQITGTDGVIEVDAFAPSTNIYDHGTSANEWLTPGEDMDSLMLEDFITGARNGSPAGATAVDGLRTLEVVLAAYRSSHTGQPERVECNQEAEKA